MNRFAILPRSKGIAACTVLLSGAVLLTADYSFAQVSPDPMQCQQIRQAAAQYGFANARRHALETYGPEAVKSGDKCFARQTQRLSSSHALRKNRGHRSAGLY